MKKTLLIVAASLSFGYANAQMKLGNNPTTTNANAVLEMETTNKGLLLPRVALTSTTSFAPLTAHVAGMAVYNTATAGDVTPGYYFDNGTAWVRVADANAAVTNLYTANGTLTGARTVNMGANNLSFMGTGMVGIGTTDPKNCMHILCEPTATSNITTSYVKGMTITGKGGAGYTGPGFYLENTDNPAGKKLFKINYTANGGSEGFVNFQSVTDDASGAVTEGILALTHAGRVGVGTTAPLAKFEVVGDGNGAAAGHTARFYTAGTVNSNTYIDFDNGAAGKNTRIISSDTLEIQSGSQSMHFLPSGDLGIGTSTPAAKLDVNGQVKISGGTPGAGKVLTSDAAGLASWATPATVGNTLYNGDGTLTGNRNVAMGSNNLAFTGTGMIGIGTTDPKNCMHILCEPTATSNITTSYVKGMTITGKGGGGYTGPGFYLENTDNPAGKKLFKINYTANGGAEGFVNFQSVSDDASAGVAFNIMAITHSGKVGIGTNAPAGALDVRTNTASTLARSVFRNDGATSRQDVQIGATGAGDLYVGVDATGGLYSAGAKAYIDNRTTGRMGMGSGGAEHLTLLANGNVGVGTNAPTALFHVNGTTLAAAWSTSSDARLKTNIVAVEQGLDKIMQLQPVAYDKKESLTSTKYDKKEIGFIAQDLRKVLPTVVQENGTDKLLSVNYTELIPVLTKAIQEQQAQIEALKKENAGLKASAAKVSELESQMSALNAKMELFLKAASTTAVGGGK